MRIPFTPIVSLDEPSIVLYKFFANFRIYHISKTIRNSTPSFPRRIRGDNFHEREFFQRQRKSRDFLARAVIRSPVIRGPNIFTVVASYEKQGKKREREKGRGDFANVSAESLVTKARWWVEGPSTWRK